MMVYSNNNNVKKLKSWLMITGLLILIAMTVLIFIEKFVALAILAGIFLLGLIIVAILNFQYIRIMEEKNKLTLRYYSIFSLDRTYKAIEIPIEHLRKVEVFKLLFGLKWDLQFTVRIRQGIADYPPVSLSAIPIKDRKKIVEQLKLLVPLKI
jgi:hypothetical protein